jgi:FlaA1/EpsC-like NDP-sugar epimerase
VRILSRDEFKQFELEQELAEYNSKLRFLIGDVRDVSRLNRAMNDIDIVFDLAAMKHVPACEYNPFEAVRTNVIGTENVINTAMANNVKKVVFTSTDKAIGPTNVMGATKLLAERLIISANFTQGMGGTMFSVVRFGNVMGSRGSVIPFFRKQILKDRKVSITVPEMTRYMMSISQAAELTIKAAELATGGEVFVLKMPTIKLIDLVDVVIERICREENINPKDIMKEVIGLRAGEKMYEELMTEEESQRAFELDEMYVIKPELFLSQDLEKAEQQDAMINVISSMSETVLTKSEIHTFLDENYFESR